MDRRHLEYFVAIAELGSFTRAAQSLSIAQPSLSHAIGWFERDLGCELFERHGRGVRLTTAGEALLEPARRALRSFEAARGAVRATTEGGFGQLSIIGNTLWVVDPLANLIGYFRALHPQVRFTVGDPARRSDVLDALRLGGADLGLLEGPPPSGSLASLWVADHEYVAVLPRGATSVPASLSIDDLAPFGLVSTPAGTAVRTFLDDLLGSVGRSTDIAVETAHMASLVPLVLSGAGAAVLPSALAAEAAAKGARVVRLDAPGRIEVHLVWRDGRLSPLARQFVDFCAMAVAPLADAAIDDGSFVDSRPV